MDSLTDIHALFGNEFAEPKDDYIEAIKNARTFSFLEPGKNGRLTKPNGIIQTTALVLGEGYPVIVVSRLRRRIPKSVLRTTPPSDVSGYELADVAEFEYSVEHNGYVADFDKALLHAIASHNDMDVNDTRRFVMFAIRMLRSGRACAHCEDPEGHNGEDE